MPGYKPIVKHRNGMRELYDEREVADSLFEAQKLIGKEDQNLAYKLAKDVTLYLENFYSKEQIDTNQLREVIEDITNKEDPELAEAYFAWRLKRAIQRLGGGELFENIDAVVDDTQ